VPGLNPPRAPNDVVPLDDWTSPAAPDRAWRALVPAIDRDGNERAGIRLPDIAVPRGTFTGWNLYAPPYPAGELADRDGTALPFAATRDDAQAAGDPRASLAERYAAKPAYAAAVDAAVTALVQQRLLLDEDAASYRATARE
jgi:hypothetical protein